MNGYLIAYPIIAIAVSIAAFQMIVHEEEGYEHDRDWIEFSVLGAFAAGFIWPIAIAMYVVWKTVLHPIISFYASRNWWFKNSEENRSDKQRTRPFSLSTR